MAMTGAVSTKGVEVKVEVLGSGCSKCRAMVGMIERAAHAVGVEVDIAKVEERRSSVLACARRRR